MVNEEALFLLIEGLYSILVHCKMTPFSSSSVRLYYAVWPGAAVRIPGISAIWPAHERRADWDG